MRNVVSTILLLVAAIHALPAVGVLGAGRISQLYDVSILDPNLELLLRHRAVLFGVIAGLLAFAATRADLHRLALVTGTISVSAFLLLAQSVPTLTPGLVSVTRADWLALLLLAIGAVAHLWRIDDA
jgi:hypothetical protein